MEQDAMKTVVLEAIKKRRSTRSYLQDPVPEEVLNEIIEAGRYAPSAGNSQATRFYVISSAEKLAELRAVVTSTLAEMPIRDGMSPHFANLLKRAKEGPVDVTYGAPALIVTTSIKGSQNASADCACALQNMMLAACVCGVANVWINQFFLLREAPPIKEFFASLGVTDDEEICGSLSVGYSENTENEPLPRTGYEVSYIR